MGSGDGGTYQTIRKLAPKASVLEGLPVEMMRSVCDPACYYVHIGGNCNLDKEMNASFLWRREGNNNDLLY